MPHMHFPQIPCQRQSVLPPCSADCAGQGASATPDHLQLDVDSIAMCVLTTSEHGSANPELKSRLAHTVIFTRRMADSSSKRLALAHTVTVVKSFNLFTTVMQNQAKRVPYRSPIVSCCCDGHGLSCLAVVHTPKLKVCAQGTRANNRGDQFVLIGAINSC